MPFAISMCFGALVGMETLSLKMIIFSGEQLPSQITETS